MNKSVGEVLKSARLEKGLTLEQVSAQTRIRVYYLDALEKDQKDLLPSEVQGRGFLRLYAGFLGINGGSLIAEWSESKDEENLSAPEIASPPAQNEILTKLLQFLAFFPFKHAPKEPNPPTTDEVASTDSTQQVAQSLKERLIKVFKRPVSEFPPENYQLPEVSEEISLPIDSEAPTPSQMIFNEIGADLKRQRESLGLKIMDIERYILVRQRFIEALEDGRLNDLPSPVQGRGMLNNYARFLEMDTENLLLRFAEGLQSRQLERNINTASSTIPTMARPRVESPSKPGTLRQLLSPDLIIGASVIFVLIVFAIWSASQIAAARNNELSTVPAISNILAVSPTNNGTKTPTATFTPAANLGDIGGPAGVLPGQGDSSNPTSIPTSSAPLQLYIVSRQRAYLQVVSDGKVVFNGRVTPGNAYPYTAEKKLEMKTGNAAALQVFFNQKDMGTLGLSGQVVSLVFTMDGIQTPTPIASLTPTPSRQPSVTSQPSPTPATPTVTPLIP
jgi:cytoskeleton protein RodZ